MGFIPGPVRPVVRGWFLLATIAARSSDLSTSFLPRDRTCPAFRFGPSFLSVRRETRRRPSRFMTDAPQAIFFRLPSSRQPAGRIPPKRRRGRGSLRLARIFLAVIQKRLPRVLQRCWLGTTGTPPRGQPLRRQSVRRTLCIFNRRRPATQWPTLMGGCRRRMAALRCFAMWSE